jgi:FAD/FMN-containing dehydrogenase
MVGAGRASSPAAATTGVLLRSHGLAGVERTSDTEIEVRPGTTVQQLYRELDGMGLALAAVPDGGAETVAGAVLTGSHGSGQQLPSVAAGVVAMELVLATGEVVRVDADHDCDLFQAARAGLGGFGIVTRLWLSVVPAYLMRRHTCTDRFEHTVAAFDEWESEHDRVEFDWYPHTDRTVVHRLSRRPGAVAATEGQRDRPDRQAWATVSAGGFARVGRSLPPAVPALNRLAAALQSDREATGLWWRVLPTPPPVRFVELEIAVPRPMLRPALTMLRRAIDDAPESATVPVRISTGPAEESWLAAAEGRATAYIDLRAFHRSPYQRYFDTAESVLAEFDGRPRLSTAHSMAADRLAERYPKFADVQRVRDRVDKDRRFGNAYLARVLGV